MDSATHDEVIDEPIRDVILYLGVAIANEDNLVRPKCILCGRSLFCPSEIPDLFMDTLYKYSFHPSSFRFHIIFLNRDELPGPKVLQRLRYVVISINILLYNVERAKNSIFTSNKIPIPK